MATVLRPPLYSPRLTVAFPYRAIFDEPQNRLLNLLKNQDKQFGAPGDWQTYDYPNPRGRVFPSDLRTWLDPLKRQLIGKDQFFGAPGQPPDYDWQNPIRRAVLPQAHTLGNLLETTLGIVAAVPFHCTEWPVPVGRVSPIGLRTFVDPLKIQLLVPFNFEDWQNPLRRIDSVARLGGFPNLLTDTLATAAGIPFSLMDWPNPVIRRVAAMQDANLSVYIADFPVVIVDDGAIYIPCFRPRRR